MTTRWRIRSADPDAAASIAAAHNISPTLAQLLLNRGFSAKDDIDAFLNHRLSHLADPFRLPGVEEAVELLISAIREKKRVLLFGDYDVDGMTGSAIMYSFLCRFGVPVEIYIPDRSREGYGLSQAALEEIHRRCTDILVTIDNGTTAFQELQWARDHGMKIIVIDHHESPKTMPPCEALINPKHPQSAYPDQTLCSAGLTFNLLVALRQRLRDEGFFQDMAEPDLREWLDLVCLGTIADMVPLSGQNRVLVRYGLRHLGAAKRPGIAALKQVGGLENRRIGSTEVGYGLAPRLNAAGRLADAQLGVRLLVTEDQHEALRLAEHLEKLNQERRRIEQDMVEGAVRLIEAMPDTQKRMAIVVASPDWHAGVMGIVAARLTHLYHRPAVVIALDGEEGKGSARSYGDIDLYQSLSACQDLMKKFGGHTKAAGMSLRADQVPELTERLQEVIETQTKPEERLQALEIDQRLPCADVEAALVNELDRLEPFGIGNPEPLFITEPVRFVNPRVVGRGHLKTTLAGQERSWPAIGFGLADAFERMPDKEGYFEVAYRPFWSEFQGKRNLELQLQALRPYSEGS